MIKPLPEREKHTIGVAAWNKINELITYSNEFEVIFRTASEDEKNFINERLNGLEIRFNG